MRPRVAAPWPRRKRPVAPSHGIWVTDEMLDKAVARFYRRTETTCRAFGTRPGSLDVHRRIRRRHMTGALPTGNPYPQLWHFEVLRDRLAQQWEPPTSPERRHQEASQLSLSGLWKRFLAWLEDANLDEPFLTPPAETTELGTKTKSAVASVAVTATKTNALQACVERVYMHGHDLRDPSWATFNQALESHITQGALTEKDVKVILDPPEGMARPDGSRVADYVAETIRTLLIRVLVHQMAQSTVLSDHRAVPKKLWDIISDAVRCLRSDLPGLMGLSRCIRDMSAIQRNSVPTDVLAGLCQTFLQRQADELADQNWRPFDLVKLGETWRQLDSSQWAELSSSMERWLTKSEARPHSQFRCQFQMRFGWLLLQNCTRAQNESVVETADRIREFCLENGRLTPLQRWQLAVTQLRASRAGFGEEVDVPEEQEELDFQREGKIMMDWSYVSRVNQYWWPRRWLSLACQATRIGNSGSDQDLRELLRQFCAIDAECESKSIRYGQTISHDSYMAKHVTAAEAFAIVETVQECPLVAELFRACRGGPSRHQGQMVALDWLQWGNHVEAVVKNPHTQSWVFFILGIDNIHNTPISATAGSDQLAELLTRMSSWYVEGKDQSTRPMLRQLSECMRRQRRISGSVSPEMVANVAAATLADLKNGHLGRRQRHDWLYGLISEAQGKEAARKVRRTIMAWTAANRARKMERQYQAAKEAGTLSPGNDDKGDWYTM